MSETYEPITYHLHGQWQGYVQAPTHVTTWDTGMEELSAVKVEMFTLH